MHAKLSSLGLSSKQFSNALGTFALSEFTCASVHEACGHVINHATRISAFAHALFLVFLIQVMHNKPARLRRLILVHKWNREPRTLVAHLHRAELPLSNLNR